MSQMNRNAAYVYDVDGLTAWEKLRVIRGFLLDRQTELKLSKLKHEDAKKKMLKLDEDDIERIEFFIREPFMLDIIDDCEREVKFLEEYEKQLAEEAEKTRIAGKSDKDMYELNYLEEKIQRLVLKVQSEVYTHGVASPDTMQDLLRCRPALQRVAEHKLIKSDTNVPQLIDHSPNNSTYALTILED